MNKPVSVLQEWVQRLTFMQQSVLITAMRGPDGIAKDHVSKLLIRWLRRCVLYSAFNSKQQGQPFAFTDPFTPGGGSFTGPSLPSHVVPEPTPDWRREMDLVLRDYLATLDEVPHHFQLHFMHAAEIVGYEYHKDEYPPWPPPTTETHTDIREWWFRTYCRLANDMHLNVETYQQMKRRLGDFEATWREAEEVTAKGPARCGACQMCWREENPHGDMPADVKQLPATCRERATLGQVKYYGTGKATSQAQVQNIPKPDVERSNPLGECPQCRSMRREVRLHGCKSTWHHASPICPRCESDKRDVRRQLPNGHGELDPCGDTWHDVEQPEEGCTRYGGDVCEPAKDAMRTLHPGIDI